MESGSQKLLLDDWWIINFSLNRIILCDVKKKFLLRFFFWDANDNLKENRIKNCENWRIND